MKTYIQYSVKYNFMDFNLIYILAKDMVENSPMEDLAAVYVMVSQSGAAGEDGSVNLKIIESMDEFLCL